VTSAIRVVKREFGGALFDAVSSMRVRTAPATHSITSWARAISVGGTSKPSALAVFRFDDKFGYAPFRVFGEDPTRQY
jgi:hypothetical protein